MTALMPSPTVAEINAAPFIPADPESLDATRPDDLDVCDVCQGSGEIQIGWAGDPHEYDGEPCWGCAGTGQRGAA